ncbi:MAG: helix-hairpin-helix domain-containing protein [Bacteroidales bacterium]|jgi:DNA uptake protein ComE-like DNA-binding protein|nr:helix-hairpin-helix domain-containing protein [Bacteroidales bacterium]
MFRKANNWIKSFLSLNKSEQRGILVLLLLIILLFAINLLLPYLISDESNDFSSFKNEIENFQQSQQRIADSLRIEHMQNRGELNEELAGQKLNPFPFNPNQLPREVWLKLGLTEKQISTIKNYEAKGGKFKTEQDLKKMYSISDAEFAILEPYIRIPSEFKTRISPLESKIEERQPITKKIRYLNTEINSADSATFVNALKLPPWIAARIISYRDIMGGFYKPSQLKEVYGLDSSEYHIIEKYLQVDTSLIVKLHINTAGFKEILRHPYTSYDITKEIVNYRNQRGIFKATDQLIELGILTESNYIKLKPYLSVKLDFGDE